MAPPAGARDDKKSLGYDAGSSTVVVKMGSKGAILGTSDGLRETIAPFPCRPVDATGAGDTFCGAFLARLVTGDPLGPAAIYAACASALATTAYGAALSIPVRDVVLRELGSDQL